MSKDFRSALLNILYISLSFSLLMRKNRRMILLKIVVTTITFILRSPLKSSFTLIFKIGSIKCVSDLALFLACSSKSNFSFGSTISALQLPQYLAAISFSCSQASHFLNVHLYPHLSPLRSSPQHLRPKCDGTGLDSLSKTMSPVSIHLKYPF